MISTLTINTVPIHNQDFARLIEFDWHGVFLDFDGPTTQAPPPLTENELSTALNRKDELNWLYVDNCLAGYYWFRKDPDVLYIPGLVIAKNYFGMGLATYALNLAEETAKKNNLCLCRLDTAPLNGRAVRVYLKHGYRIVRCIPNFLGPQYPNTFRFILEKELLSNPASKENIIDTREVICSDNIQLKQATDDGYVGVAIIRSENKDNLQNKIIFNKYA